MILVYKNNIEEENNKIIRDFMLSFDGECFIYSEYDDWNKIMTVIDRILNIVLEDDIESYYSIIDNIPDLKATTSSVIDFLKGR